MIDLIEEIGRVVGVVAFLGLAVIAFLIFQQAREIRRLREWAGRAPERASEAAEASLAAAELRGEHVEPVAAAEPGRLARLRERVRDRARPGLRELDRRLPVEPRYIGAVLVAAVIAAGVVTSGFGLIGGDGGGGGSGGRGDGGGAGDEKIEVTVLNATQVEDAAGTEIEGVTGLASRVADEVVRPAGYRIGREADAASGFEETVVMYEPGAEREGRRLARDVSEQLGSTVAEPIEEEVAQRSGGAPLVLVVGFDDSSF